MPKEKSIFSVGDGVVHCTHGAGVITEKKEMQITGTPKSYIVLQMLGSCSTLMVPTDRAEQRLRPVCKKATLRRLLTSELTDDPEELPQDYKKRTKHIEDRLKSGETEEWIGVVRDLTYKGEQKPLSQGDRQLLDRAEDLLSGELALAQGIPPQEALLRLKSMLQRRCELADSQAMISSWWRTLGQKVREPLGKSSIGTS